MILEPKKTTLAYRCPSCGAGVMSAVGLFDLTAEKFKLKCSCSESAMTVVYTDDSKIRLSAPCVFCPKPHTYTVSSSLFFKDDIFIFPCPYTDMTIAAAGELNQVKAELSRSELELLEILEKSGINSFAELKSDGEELSSEAQEILLYAISSLSEDGKIECACEDFNGDYEVSFAGEGVIVKCKRCGAQKILQGGSLTAAQDLLCADKLILEPPTLD